MVFKDTKIRLLKIYSTAHPVWTVGCIIAIFQTMPVVSSFHLGFVSDKGVMNIRIKSEAPFDIAITVNSINSTIDFDDKNKLDETMEQIDTSTTGYQIDFISQTTLNDQEILINDATATEQIATMAIVKSEPKVLLQEAFSEDDENETKRLIKIVYRRFTKKEERRPLTVAAERCEPDVADMLIKNGADVNRVGIGGWRPLHVAIYNNCKEIVQMMIDNGADINAKIRIGYSALDIADIYGYGEIVQLLSDSIVEGEGQQYVNEVTYEDGDLISA